MSALKKWFTSLSLREQKMVVVASVFGGIGFFYFAIWSPLNSAIESKTTTLNALQQDLSWVSKQSSRAQVLRQSSNKQSFSGSLTQLVNQTTRSADIPVSRMQPQGDELQVWIDQVAFNKLIQWLNTLESRGVVIIQSDVSEVDTRGFVQVRRLQLGKM